MAETECEKEVIKRAFMFSCFCGLRISDIRKLKWEDIEQVTDANGNITKKEIKLIIHLQT